MPKTFVEGGSTPPDQAGPATINPKLWWKVLNAAQRTQWRVANRGRPTEAGEPGGTGTASTAMGAIKPSGSRPDEHDSFEERLWDRWETIRATHAGPSLIPAECYDGECAASTPVAPAEAGGCGGAAPRMPKRRGPPRPHRQKNHGARQRRLYTALVARPVGRAEIAAKPAATQAMNYEWTNFRNICLGRGQPTGLVQCPKGRPETVSSTCTLAISPASASRRTRILEATPKKYKGRVVFLGNSAADKYHDEATLRDMGN